MKKWIPSAWKFSLLILLFSTALGKAQPAVIASPGQLEFGQTPVYQIKYLLVELTNQSDAMVYFLQPVASSPIHA